MRIGCLQFAPQVGDVDNNLNRADSILNRANPQDLDLLVLPELAFSGYNFKSLQQIAPFLEPSGSGISSLWTRTTALKYDCTVITGYPEKVDPALKWPTDPEYHNSAIVVSPDGETAANYRKSHLYYTDETWALEGTGFFAGRLPGLGRAAIGICMDINPYKFQVPWTDFEFAYHVLDNGVKLVIVSMAWITQEDAEVYTQKPDEPDMDTLTYWLARLDPVVRAEPDHEIIVVFANRCGQEDGATYAGTSAVVGIQGTDVRVYGILGRGSKDLLVIDTDDPPYAKLVFRPTDKVPADGDEPHSPSRSSQSGSPPTYQAAESSNNIPSDTLNDQTSMSHIDGQKHQTGHNYSSGTSSPVHQEITVLAKPDRRSTLVEFSPISDGRGFFDDDGSPITPTYEEQYWWPSPLSNPAHRRYHSTSSLLSDSTHRRRKKTLQNRSSVGSALSDKTSSKRMTKRGTSLSSPIGHRDVHAYAVSRDAHSMMEAAQHSALSPLASDYLLNEFVKPDAGFGSLSLSDSHRQRPALAHRSEKSSPRTQSYASRPIEAEAVKAPGQNHIDENQTEDQVDRVRYEDRTEHKHEEFNGVEEWLTVSAKLPAHSPYAVRSGSTGLKKTKARKERPSYINDWDEPRSYSPMEFRTPRAMTFEEISALRSPLSA
ncbi:carbon-nitrogen hydrolase domain-containing protein [Sarocladium implicatum]|nr:carbon-nitrogen hydrolase domain-containing protein [Sarocladium implicatum]